MFPVRHGLTVGSAEFEKVMQCFKIENKVDETKNSTTKRHKFQGQQDDEIDVSIDVKQRDAERTTGDLNTTFKSLSLGNGGSSTGIKTPAPRNWSYSTAITSSEKLRKTEQRFRRNSAPISAKKAFPSSNNERFGKASLSSGYSTASPAAPIRNRRASLPSLRGSYPGPVMSSGNSTEKVKSFLHDYVRPNLNVKLPERRRSGPETYFSKANDTSSSMKCVRMRRFSMPARTPEKFPRITGNKRIASENDSEILDDVGKDVPLEHVFRLWNVRLPKAQVIDLRRELAYEKMVKI